MAPPMRAVQRWQCRTSSWEASARASIRLCEHWGATPEPPNNGSLSVIHLQPALPEPFRKTAEASAASAIVDPAEWGHTRRPRRPVHLDARCPMQVEGSRPGPFGDTAYRTEGEPADHWSPFRERDRSRTTIR